MKLTIRFHTDDRHKKKKPESANLIVLWDEEEEMKTVCE